MFWVCALCDSPHPRWMITKKPPEIVQLPLQLGDLVCDECEKALPKEIEAYRPHSYTTADARLL